jgi:hypothetical protein
MALAKAAVKEAVLLRSHSPTPDSVDVVFFSKTAQSAAEIRVDMLPRQVKVGFPDPGGQDLRNVEHGPVLQRFCLRRAPSTLRMGKSRCSWPRRKSWQRVGKSLSLVGDALRKAPLRLDLTHTKKTMARDL